MPAGQEQRHVRPEPRRDLGQLIALDASLPEAFEQSEGGGGVAAAAAEAGCQRYTLQDAQPAGRSAAEIRRQDLGRPAHQVVGVGDDGWVYRHAESVARGCLNAVVERDRLGDRDDLVEAVRPPPEHLESEVDLCVGTQPKRASACGDAGLPGESRTARRAPVNLGLKK